MMPARTRPWIKLAKLLCIGLARLAKWIWKKWKSR
jgi:hypothetical protein